MSAAALADPAQRRCSQCPKWRSPPAARRGCRRWPKPGDAGAQAAIDLKEQPDPVPVHGADRHHLDRHAERHRRRGRLRRSRWRTGCKTFGDAARARRDPATGLVVVIITFFTIIFGELVPKRIGQLYPEPVARLVARPMRWLPPAARPFVGCCRVHQAVLRLLGIHATPSRGVTEEEIAASLEEGVDAGVIEAARAPDGAQRVPPRRPAARLDDGAARRHRVAGRRRAAGATCSRTIGRARGAFLVPGVPRRPGRRGGRASRRSACCSGAGTRPSAVARRAAQPPVFVPETLTGMELLEQFRGAGAQLVFVVDEYGVVQGLMTLRDLLEAITGEFAAPADDDAWVSVADGTRPPRPASRVRSAISSNSQTPSEPPSCRWMSRLAPYRAARSKTTSRCPTGSRSMPAGSMPPMVSTPCLSASSSSSAVPGLLSSPCCGNATCCTVTRPSSRCTAARTASMPRNPTSGSMSVWLPRATSPTPTSAPAAPQCDRRSECPARRGAGDRWRPHPQRIAGRVRDPRPAVERLVEVAVRIDEPRQHESAVNIQHLGIALIDAGSIRSMAPARISTSAGASKPHGRAPRSSRSDIRTPRTRVTCSSRRSGRAPPAPVPSARSRPCRPPSVGCARPLPSSGSRRRSCPRLAQTVSVPSATTTPVLSIRTCSPLTCTRIRLGRPHGIALLHDRGRAIGDHAPRDQEADERTGRSAGRRILVGCRPSG